MVEHARCRTGSRAAATSPSRPTEADGVTEAWIAFETEVGRGSGHLRLKEGRAWTLLTTLDELKGHEETRGPAGRAASSTAPSPIARAGWSAAGARPRSSGVTTQPYVVIIGGGQGGIGLGRAAAPARRADRSSSTATRGRATVAQPLQVALPARPGLVRPPSLHQVPRELARVLAEGQDRRLARDVHAGDGAQLLGLDRGQARAAGIPRRQEWEPCRSSARAARADVAPQAARLRHGHVEPAQPAPARGHGRLPGRAAPLVPAPGPDGYRGKRAWSDRLQQLRARHLRRAVGGRRRRDHGPALLHPHRALGHAHGHRPGRPVLRAGGGRRGHHREGRHDLRVAALPDPARVPDPALRRRCASATPTSTVAWRPSGSSSTGARTARACS